MALARVQYESDGSTTTYSIPFPYINRDDIKVTVDGTTTQDFVFLDGSTIDLDSAPTQGVVIDILRETERENLLVEFNDGSTLLESDLTLAAQQSFFLAQESYDQTGSTLAVADDGSYSASGRKISRLGTPAEDDHATNKEYVDQVATDGYNAHTERTAAEEARDRAEEWAQNPRGVDVVSGEYSALHHADVASDHAADALSYRDTAETHKNDAQSSATSASDNAAAASLSETSAANSADSAESSATDASQSAAQADDLATQYAGSTVGFDASAYDFGFVATATTYFNRDFGGLA